MNYNDNKRSLGQSTNGSNTNNNTIGSPEASLPREMTQSTSPGQNPVSRVLNRKSKFEIRKSESPVQPVVHPCQNSEPSTLDAGPSTPYSGPPTLNSNNHQPSTNSEVPASNHFGVAQGISDSDSTANQNSKIENRKSQFSLKRGLGFWQLTFNGRESFLKHEQGMSYVAYLLLNQPAEPIHALDLATRIAASEGKQVAMTEMINPLTGKFETLDSTARIQERSPELDDALAMRRVLREQAKFEAKLEDELLSDQDREEFSRELIRLYDFEKSNSGRVTDAAQRAARSVRMAIKRLHSRLARANDQRGQPDTALREFATHIHDCIIVPSSRGSGLARGRTRVAAGLAGCFTCELSPNISWQS